jgi:histidinol-phosphate/aromatic aminotransferase/cobyric acid decarboxylase-like protein
MVDIRRDAKAFQEACERKGVLVGRPFAPLTTHARVSIGTMDEMREAMEILRGVLAQP